MTDTVLSASYYDAIVFEVGQTNKEVTRLLHSDYRPSWLRYVRVWELVPALRDQAEIDVLADVLEVGVRSSADALIREFGVVGAWRPSTVLVRSIVDHATNRLLASDVLAHALWNTDLHVGAGPNHAFEIRLEVDHPAQRHEERRVFRAMLHFTEMTPEELGQGDAYAPLRDHVARLERRIQQLEGANAFTAKRTRPKEKG